MYRELILCCIDSRSLARSLSLLGHFLAGPAYSELDDGQLGGTSDCEYSTTRLGDRNSSSLVSSDSTSCLVYVAGQSRDGAEATGWEQWATTGAASDDHGSNQIMSK